ncbi:hypothetical protein [Methylophaga sp.]|uniref:hypothetical protein n=1 Tax=Methylophaga sp. TaxID=2024840 RepID=UPI0014013A0B|nr:hypothetical protein [Methylophaga sp.]MTI64873.1 hypothetical protein [Methylophaga sp.]
MTQELIITPFSAYSDANKIKQAAWLVCFTCQIESDKNNLIALIGKGDEPSNRHAIETWLERRLTEFEDEDLFIQEVEQLSYKLLDRLNQYQRTVF